MSSFSLDINLSTVFNGKRIERSKKKKKSRNIEAPYRVVLGYLN